MLNVAPAPPPSNTTVKAAANNTAGIPAGARNIMSGTTQIPGMVSASAAPAPSGPNANNAITQAIQNSPAGQALNQEAQMIQKQLGLVGSLGADNGAQAAAQAMLPDQLRRLDLQLQGLGVQQGAARRAFGQLGASENQTRMGFDAAQNALINAMKLGARSTAFQNAIAGMLGTLNAQQYQGMGRVQTEATNQQVQQLRSQAAGTGAAGSAGLPWWVGSQQRQLAGYMERYNSEAMQAKEQARLQQYNNNTQLAQQRISTANQMAQNRMGFNKSQIDYLKSVQDTQDTLKQLGFQTQDVNLQKQLAQIGAAHAGAGSNAALQAFMAQTGLVQQLAGVVGQQGMLGQSIMGSPGFQASLQPGGQVYNQWWNNQLADQTQNMPSYPSGFQPGRY